MYVTGYEFANYPTARYFAWMSCDAGDDDHDGHCYSVGNGGDSYTITASDQNRSLRAVVRAQNIHGTAFSIVDSDIVAGSGDEPQMQTAPTITGTIAAGQTVHATTGQWSNNPASFSYQWFVCADDRCDPIADATSADYTLGEEDSGLNVFVTVRASNVHGPSPAVYSGYTRPAGDPISVPVTRQAPANTSAPTVSGTAQVGSTLNAGHGNWTNNPTSYSYDWQRCTAGGRDCTDIATGSTYTLAEGDAGHTFRVRVNASNAGGTALARSEMSAVIVAATPHPGAPDVQISLVSAAKAVVVGQQAATELALTNRGNAPATNIVISLSVPAGSEFVSATIVPGGTAASTGDATGFGTCALSGSTVTCQVGTLAAGQSADLILVVKALRSGAMSTTVHVSDDSTRTTGTPPSDIEVNQNVLVCTISGGGGNDVLHGTAARDIICGFGGDDTIYGVGGNDVIYGGAGADRIYGGAGSDQHLRWQRRRSHLRRRRRRPDRRRGRERQDLRPGRQ